ncbi:hypothetical protein [Anabaena sp. PCC 7108]|uniref:hypothetical protein n=1 Tax=Anabaena sp. PCC 7108 TaxID=163908 RepID=UPI0003469FE5|nr:hypothetical protein [Anabaena sp. PCC 7108]
MKVSIVFQSSGADRTVGETRQIQQALNGLGSASTNITQQNQKAGLSVADLAFKFNNVVQAVQTLAATAKPAYDLLIGQNEQLNQQLLAARANLVATNKVLSDGVEIKDPTQAIEALNEPIKQAVQQIRENSLDIVGVTSNQLIDTFQILTSQAASLTNQSKELPDAIGAATNLTTDFAAALGTIGLPLNQARQEITSILTGTIDTNSVLAKNLGITNQQVQSWKAQGILVDELRNRLNPFVEGNKLAARSISGITSNIQEVLEITAQAAGEPLLEPLVNTLEELYLFLKDNQEELQNFSQDAILKFLSLAQAVGDAAMRIGDVLLPTIQDLRPSAEIFADTFITGLKVSADVVANLVEALQPLIQGLVNLTNIATEGFEQAQNNLAELAGTAQLSQEAIQSYAGVTETLLGQATKSIKEQKTALDLRNQSDKDKIQLTKEQVASETKARQSAQQVITDLKNQRKELVQLSVVGTENKIALKGQIAVIDAYLTSLERQNGQFKTSIANIQVQAKSLDTLGNTYKQLQDKAENARRVLSEGAGGDSNRANQSAKELISLTEQRRQLGQITAQQAVKELEAVRANTKISFEQQVAAAEAITKVQQNQGERRLADIRAKQQQTQNLIDQGIVSQSEGERRLTSLKQQELEIRLKNTQQALARERKEGRGSGDTAKQLTDQEKQLQVEIVKTRTDGLRKLQGVYIKDLETSLSKASDAVKAAETSRLTQIQQLLNQGVISQKQAEELRLNAKRQSIAEDLKIEQERLAKLLALPKTANPEDEESRQGKIRASRQRTADLQLQLLQNEYDKQQQIRAAAIKAIEERAGAQFRASASINSDLEKEKAAYDAINQAIDASKQLLESRAAVQKSLSNLQQTQTEGEIQILQQALALRKEIDKSESPEAKAILQTALNKLVVDGAITELSLVQQRQAIENQLAQQKREAALAEIKRQQQSLALELQKNQIIAGRALLEAKIAENKAKQDLNAAESKLATAKENPQDTEAIKNAQQSVDLAKQAIDLTKQNVENAQKQVALQPELAENEKKRLAADQEAIRSQLDVADKTRLASQSMELAGLEAAKFAEAMKAAQEAAAAAEKAAKEAESAVPPATPTSRFTGGPMTAGQPYLVGDGPGGEFIPGVSEVVVPGTSSYVVSARKVAELMNPVTIRAASPAPSNSGNFNQLTREIQGLRDDLRQRKPISQNQFNFYREDNEIDQVSQAMDLIRTSMPL